MCADCKAEALPRWIAERETRAGSMAVVSRSQPFEARSQAEALNLARVWARLQTGGDCGTRVEPA